MASATMRQELPPLMREIRYFHETVDYVCLFQDDTAYSSLDLKKEQDWVKDAIKLVKAVGSDEAVQVLQMHAMDVIETSKAMMTKARKEKGISEKDYKRLNDKREAVYEAISEASPAQAGGLANEVVNTYRQWAETLITRYYFNPNEDDLEESHDLARDRLVRWMDEIPFSVKNKVNVDTIMQYEADLFRIGKTRIQERVYGRVVSDAVFENIATIRERLLDRLIELQAMVSEHDVQSQTPLTVGSRRRLEADLHAEMARFERHEDQAFCVLISVVDRFKTIRDQAGDDTCEAIMRQLASHFLTTLRPYDKIYVAGGGKIAMLLPNCDIEGALHAANRCRQRVKDQNLTIPKVKPPGVTVSLGGVQSLKGNDWQTMYDRAYKALAQAKKRGDDQVCVIDHGKIRFAAAETEDAAS